MSKKSYNNLNSLKKSHYHKMFQKNEKQYILTISNSSRTLKAIRYLAFYYNYSFYSCTRYRNYRYCNNQSFKQNFIQTSDNYFHMIILNKL